MAKILAFTLHETRSHWKVLSRGMMAYVSTNSLQLMCPEKGTMCPNIRKETAMTN
jgi:hypothetical protein